MKIHVSHQLKKLAQSAAFSVYITGGYLRNQICSQGDTDIDLCGAVVASALNLPKEYHINTVNFRLGTALIRCGKAQYEYTPFRVESYNEGGAHTPSLVDFTSDIKKDVLRRDFTVNSLYYDIKNDKLIDLVGGVADCQNKILRAVDTEKTFLSDGLRLMRLARIAAETGFKIESKTAYAAVANAHLLMDISPERKREELVKILNADLKYGVENAHYRGLKLLQKLNLLKYILPPLAKCEGVQQNPLYHKYDVLEHIFQSVKIADPSVRLAALMHDVGKPYCMEVFGKMHGHERASERMCYQYLGEEGLRFPKKVVDETAALCRHHMYDLDQKTKPNKLKMFVVQNKDIIQKLILLCQADAAGSGILREKGAVRLEQTWQNVLSTGVPLGIDQLNISGAELVEIGLFGAEIGQVLADMLEKCVAEPHLNNKEWLSEHAKRFLQRKKHQVQ